jgi:hypothetical protein
MSDLIPPVMPEQLDALIQAIERVQALEGENNRLKDAVRRLADQDATLSVQGGNVTVTMDSTLTDEEREAIEAAASWLDASDDPEANRRADAIYGFLNRAK